PSGLAPAFVGTIVLVALATAMALPVGILVAIFLNEYARPAVRSLVSLVLDVLNGIPAIVIGIFVFGLLVAGHKQSGFAGSFAVARVAGETAPLLFTSSILTQNGITWNPGQAVWSVPVAIFEYSEQPDPHLHAQAWAAALVLLAFILVTGLAGRALAARTRARL